MRNVSEKKKVVEKIKTQILCSITFFWSNSVYEIMWTNIVEPGRSQMTIWRTPFQDNSVPGMRLYPRRPDSGPPRIWLRYTRQGKRKTNSTHIERRRLASAEVWSSEQMFETIYNVRKLHWLWKTVVSKGVSPKFKLPWTENQHKN